MCEFFSEQSLPRNLETILSQVPKERVDGKRVADAHSETMTSASARKNWSRDGEGRLCFDVPLLLLPVTQFLQLGGVFPAVLSSVL
jgi:hypothetical protein